MIKTLRAAFEKIKAAVAGWLRPVVVQIVRQVVYIQRPTLRQSCKKPALCSHTELVKAGQIELF